MFKTVWFILSVKEGEKRSRETLTNKWPSEKVDLQGNDNICTATELSYSFSLDFSL